MFFPEKKELKDLNNRAVGIVLAGGLSRRMGSNKSLKKIARKSLIEMVVDRAIKQVDFLAINSNQVIDSMLEKEYEIVNDFFPKNLGPLVGILTGMKWAKTLGKNYNWLVSFPVDSPFFPKTLVGDFLENSKGCDIVIAKSNLRLHHVFSLWKLNLETELESALRNGTRKIEEFTKKFETKVVNFPLIGYDPFFNVNDINDLKEAEEIFAKNKVELK